MIDKLTNFTDYFRKIPVAFLVAIISVLGLTLFLPEKTAITLAINEFREKYRVFLGPAFLLSVAVFIARVFMFIMNKRLEKQNLESTTQVLHHLTPEERGYLIPYIQQQKNTVHVEIHDGIMNGLAAKGIVYRASNIFDLLEGPPFNLQPWARKYLEKNPDLLNGHTGVPKTPRENLHSQW